MQASQAMETKGQWFVVQTLSGQEMKAQESMEKRRSLEEMEDLLYEALVPMEKVSEVKQGKKTTVNKKFFPGYILVNAELYEANRGINVAVWNFVNDTPGVIGFIGGDRPAPLSAQEVQDIVDQQTGDEETARPKIEFEVGETVKICDGPFENFEGKIESIDPEHGKLKLSVSIFNRITPVEVGYWQVERQES